LQVLLFSLEIEYFFGEKSLSFFDCLAHLLVSSLVNRVEEWRYLTVYVEELALLVSKLDANE
jgi:hypothetical protein